MAKWFKVLILITSFGVLLALGCYFLFVHFIGSNFNYQSIFSKSNIPKAYQNYSEEQTQDTISFAVIDDKFKFDKQLNQFLSVHPNYQLPDKMKVLEYAGCGRDDMSFRKEIYFDQEPREIYRITFDEKSNIGFIDLVYSFKDSSWHCSNKSRLDPETKQRIIRRLDREILQNLH